MSLLLTDLVWYIAGFIGGNVANVLSTSPQRVERQSLPLKRPLPPLCARDSSSELHTPTTPASTDHGGLEENSTSNSHGLDAPELQEELVHLYFAHIHDKHHSLFHEPTITAQLRDGSLPRVLLYGMIALGSRFSNAPCLAFMDRRSRATWAATRAMALFDMTDISVTTIQASILLGTICFAESKTEAEALYYAVANRLAQVLNLAHRHAETETERQVNLRIWWTLYMIDIWCSTGLHLPRQAPSVHPVDLPASETVFLALQPRTLSEASASGIWAEMVNLAHIWVEIFSLNQSVIRESLSDKNPAGLEEAVETLLRRLELWSASLPLHLRKTRANLEYWGSVGLGSAFAALHLGYHYYTEVLCYQFLAEESERDERSQFCEYRQRSEPYERSEYGERGEPDDHGPEHLQHNRQGWEYSEHREHRPRSRPRPRPSTSKDYAEKCKEHAKHFCDLLYTCQETPNCECLYIMVGHMLVVTSTIYIHTLVFSARDDEIAVARMRLERNFRTLMHLQSFWVKLDVSLSRLRAFHNACKVSAEHSFGMDKWMLCFLHEHGVSVPERYADTNPMFPPTSMRERTRSASAELTLQDWYSQTFSQP